jgi:hypothetical protein
MRVGLWKTAASHSPSRYLKKVPFRSRPMTAKRLFELVEWNVNPEAATWADHVMLAVSRR